jgi:hypothetical protein
VSESTERWQPGDRVVAHVAGHHHKVWTVTSVHEEVWGTVVRVADEKGETRSFPADALRRKDQ